MKYIAAILFSILIISAPNPGQDRSMRTPSVSSQAQLIDLTCSVGSTGLKPSVNAAVPAPVNRSDTHRGGIWLMEFTEAQMWPCKALRTA